MPPIGPWKKRAFDLALSFALLLPATLICGAAALVIVAEDGASPLFIQERVGRDGRRFRLVKLRTMRIGTGDRPSHEAGTSAITRVGAFLRRTKLDELPQLWNVLAGDMSFVGPRPSLPSQIRLNDRRRELGVDQLLPGITGVGQVAGLDMSQPELLAECDAFYLDPWSLKRDLRLLWQTALGGGRGDAAAGLGR